MRTIIQTLIMTGALAFATPLMAQDVTSKNPQGIADALIALGQTTTLAVDSGGDPMIVTTGPAGEYRLWFYGCTNNVDCTVVNISVGFDLATGSTLDLMNEWNAKKLVGRAYLGTESNPNLDQYVPLGGGMSLLNFSQLISQWNFAMGEYIELIGFRG